MKKLPQTYQIGIFSEQKFLIPNIHRLRPNFEIGSLVERNL